MRPCAVLAGAGHPPAAAAGATNNIRVIKAQPEGIFERAAIRALEKWKYRVPITDGTPQGQVCMMTRPTFELEQ